STDWLRWEARPWHQADGTVGGIIIFSENVTARKDAELALRQNEENLRSLVELLPDALFINQDNRVVYINRSGLRLWRAGREEQILGRSPFELIHPDFHERVRERIHQVQATCEFAPIWETRMIALDGTIVPVETTAAPVMFGGKPALQVVVRDITTRKHAETALRESEERLRSLGDNIPDSYVYQYTISPDGTPQFLYLSAGVERVHGVAVDEALRDANVLLRQIDQPHLAPFLSAVERSREQMADFEMEFHGRRSDGQSRWVHVRSRPRRTPDGQVLWDGVATDITERKNVEEALRESEARYRLVSEQGIDVIWLFDIGANRFTYVSPSVQKLRGFSAEEILQQSMKEALAPESYREVSEGLSRRLEAFAAGDESAKTRVDEVVQTHRDGHLVPTEVVTTLVTDENGHVTHIQGVTRDITERKRAEAHIQHLNQLLGAIRNINKLIVRERNPRKLLDDACVSLQKTRDYLLVWIAIADGDSDAVVPIAWAGPRSDYLQNVTITRSDTLLGQGPVGNAMRTKEPSIFQDTGTDLAFEPWRAQALERGYRSVAAIPILQGARLFGVLSVYADHAYAFDAEEIDLLKELAGDLGFALNSIELEDARQESDERLRTAQDLLAETGRLAKIGGWEFDPQTGKGTWTDEVARIHELDPELETNKELGLGFYVGESSKLIERAVYEATEHASPYDLTLELVTAKGNHRWVRTVGLPQVADGKVVRIRGYFQDVTEMKLARDEIDQLAQFPSQNPNPVMRVNETGTVLYANAACRSILPSWAAGGLRSMPETLASGVAQALRTNSVLQVEADSEGKSFLVTIAPAAAERWVNIYAFDVSMRKIAARALEVSEQRLGEALDIAGAGHWVFDVATRSFTFNDRFYALYCTSAEREGGYVMPADEYANRFMFPEDVHLVADEIARAINEPDPNARWQLEHRVRRRDGQIRQLLVSITTIKDAEGRTIQTHGVNQDITPRKKMEEERALLATGLEQAAEAVVITNATGDITYVNPAFERITGYQRQEVIGRNPRILKSGEQDDTVYKSLWETVSRGDTWSGRMKNKRKDGTFYDAELTISPVLDAARNVVNFVAIQRDITEQLELERRFRQSQKMEAIGTLAGGIAHDFNNILAAIMGYGHLIEDSLPAEGDSRDDLRHLMAAAGRATDLVRQILTFSRQGEEHRQVIDLDLIVKEALKLLRPSLPTTIEIRFEIGSHCAVLADASQMHQVIVNLCANAYHAMKSSSGTLTVALRPVTLEPGFLELHPGLRESECVKLSVSDTGCGIPSEIMDRIFDPFFTTKPVGEGTGLGLSTVHGIVTAHEGIITVDSEAGKGTAFHIYLPRARTDAVPGTVTLAPVTGGGERILVIDDELALAKVLTRALRKLGYEVTEMVNPVNALETFWADPNRFDLIITDQTMPKVTGAQIAMEVKRVRPDLPVIVTTGHTNNLLQDQHAAAHVAAILLKPARFEDIARTVRSVLGSR
ncbi:MAG: PAS domain S-box protein, partial [Candidatus Hydrogenedentes bacterium]|nr:PAS domain S-box protein [Candidatus Hydrogenedentota bacterium]